MEKNIHNDLFIHTIKNKKNAVDFLHGVLPKEIFDKIDENYIEYDDTSYISEELKEYYSDVVIKTKYKNRETDIYFLIEHKSGLPKEVELFYQILKYIYMMITEDIKNDRGIRIIIPIVFYHGREKWEIRREFVEIYGIENEEIKKYLLNYTYILFNTKELEENNDKRFCENLYLMSVLLALKTAFEKEDIETVIKIIKKLNEGGYLNKPESIVIILGYILLTKEIKKEDLIEIIYKENKEGGRKMITFADIIREEALQQGIKEGEIKGQIKKSQDAIIKLMNKKFGLNQNEIELIRRCNDMEKLDEALESILSANDKNEVLKIFWEK